MSSSHKILKELKVTLPSSYIEGLVYTYRLPEGRGVRGEAALEAKEALVVGAGRGHRHLQQHSRTVTDNMVIKR